MLANCRAFLRLPEFQSEVLQRGFSSKKGLFLIRTDFSDMWWGHVPNPKDAPNDEPHFAILTWNLLDTAMLVLARGNANDFGWQRLSSIVTSNETLGPWDSLDSVSCATSTLMRCFFFSPITKKPKPGYMRLQGPPTVLIQYSEQIAPEQSPQQTFIDQKFCHRRHIYI